jgi:glycosyltransferase involved in cell wall biosynthesis
MKILQLIPNISGGGAERLIVDLSNQMAKKHDVTLLTLYDPREKDLFRDQLSSNIKTPSLGKKLGFDWRTIPKLYREIKKIAPDVIHNHLRTFNYLMPSIPFLGNLPIVHTVHNDAYKECPNSKIRYIRKQLFKRSNVIPVTISNKSADSFKKAYSKIEHELITNGRRYPEKTKDFNKVADEIKDYRNNEDTKVFVNIGRIIPQKNQLMLVESFNRLVNEEGANAMLLIVGGGRDNEESRNIQRQLKEAENKHDHLYLMGELPNATDYLHVADFFCLSSLYEGMPITLIEAFATGCIPVCTPVGGIPEMVEELDTSLLANSVEEDDYVQALKNALVIPPNKQEELKKQAVSLFERKYSMKHCAEKYENLYGELLS